MSAADVERNALLPPRRPRLGGRFPRWMRCQAGRWAPQVLRPCDFRAVQYANSFKGRKAARDRARARPLLPAASALSMGAALAMGAAAAVFGGPVDIIRRRR